MDSQMIRVISSPLSSTTGFTTLILGMPLLSLHDVLVTADGLNSPFARLPAVIPGSARPAQGQTALTCPAMVRIAAEAPGQRPAIRHRAQIGRASCRER